MLEAVTISLATLAWGIMFGLKLGNFWLNMTVAASFLAAIGMYAQRNELSRLLRFTPSHIAVGVVSAAALYLVFFVGDRVSSAILPFAADQVADIYGMKAQMNSLIIGALLFFIVGPAEELFWRGFLQDRFAARWGDNTGWIAGGLVYAAVHIWAWSFMLFMAALICGLFWGWMYKHYRSLWPGIISHAVWDLFIFIIVPVRQAAG